VSVAPPVAKKHCRIGAIGQGDIAPADPDLQAWMRVFSTLPVTEADLLAWVEGPLRQIFPFKKFLGGYGSLSGGRIEMRALTSSGHTPEFLSGLEDRFDLKSRGCFAWWVANQRAFMLDKTGARDQAGALIPATEHELMEIERYSLGIVAAHGVIDPFVKAGTYVSFSGVPEIQPERTLAALDLIAPVLHALFLRAQPAVRPALDRKLLTDRQRQLVDLALEGLSDKAIASRLSISDHTVGNHFRAIYVRLGISKRGQLATALR
jgi:DNA-binding CsgD family transcriptional regulator